MEVCKNNVESVQQVSFFVFQSFLKFLASHTGYPLKKLNSERILRISDTLQYEVNNTKKISKVQYKHLHIIKTSLSFFFYGLKKLRIR